MLSLQTVQPDTLELLKTLMRLPILSDMRLVGGTALALQYGHRRSVDLDFFGHTTENVDELTEAIREEVGHIQTLSATKRIKVYNIQNVKVDIVNYDYLNDTQTITISGLESGTTYSYRAYVEAYGQTYYGGEKTFTTQVKLPDLSGTWYCTIYKDDGSVLETPTLTLTSDGKATQTGSSFTSSDRVGGWSININGKVGIGFNCTRFAMACYSTPNTRLTLSLVRWAISCSVTP